MGQNGSWKTHIARNCKTSSSLMHQQELLWFFFHGNFLFEAEWHLEHLYKLELKSSFLIFRASVYVSFGMLLFQSGAIMLGLLSSHGRGGEEELKKAHLKLSGLELNGFIYVLLGASSSSQCVPCFLRVF